jgi:hypothetical protein
VDHPGRDCQTQPSPEGANRKPVDEFLRRFLLHVLPPGFVRIGHFGFLAQRRRAALLPLCFRLLADSRRAPAETRSSEKVGSSPRPLWTCPQCGGPIVLMERLSPIQLRLRTPPVPVAQSTRYSTKTSRASGSAPD